MMFWNWSKHFSAPKDSLPAPIQILTLQLPRLPFHVKSHVKKWVFSLSRGNLLVVHARNLLKLLNFLNFLNLHGRPAPGTRHCGMHFAIGLGNFKNWPMANSREKCFYLILSLQNLECWFVVTEVAVSSAFHWQCTTYQSSICVNFKREIFILHLTQHFHLGSGTGWVSNIHDIILLRTQYVLICTGLPVCYYTFPVPVCTRYVPVRTASEPIVLNTLFL